MKLHVFSIEWLDPVLCICKASIIWIKPNFFKLDIAPVKYILRQLCIGFVHLKVLLYF